VEQLQVKIGCNLSLAFLFTVVLAVTGCSSAPYRYESFEPTMLSPQAETQSAGDVRVTAAVPSKEQATAIFGFPIYDRGIQPVWLEIENSGPNHKRYAPTGTDRDYFSPIEVAYMHRKGFSKQTQIEMERRLHGLGIERRIEPGETVTGFIFTNASPGTKNLYVDVFSGQGEDHSFAFFLNVPGFISDHAKVDFASLYQPSEIQDFGPDEFRATLADLPCCSVDRSGQQLGLPLGAIAIGTGQDVLRALLRSGWYETSWTRDKSSVDMDKAHFLFGRLPDAVFRIQRRGGIDRDQLHVWLAPWRLNGQPVWVYLITHFIGQRTKIKQFLFGSNFDPDMDSGRKYLLQSIWYGQGLKRVAWLESGGAVSIDEPRTDFTGSSYFTDGYRVVLWLSGEPMSLLDTEIVELAPPPSP